MAVGPKEIALSEWIEHTPGPCPVSPESVVEYRLSYISGIYGPTKAASLAWTGGITHYRLAEPASPAPSDSPVPDEPKRSPTGYYYRVNGAHIQRCVIGEAWAFFGLIGDMHPDELRFIADVIEASLKDDHAATC